MASFPKDISWTNGEDVSGRFLRCGLDMVKHPVVDLMNDPVRHRNPVPLWPHLMAVPCRALKQHFVSFLLKPELALFRGHVTMQVGWVDMLINGEFLHGRR